jgi:o-succinylbenzoate synthase
MDIDPFALDMTAPLATAAGDIERREGFVVRVTRDGTTGLGEATPLPGWTESLADCRGALDRAARHAASGADPLAPLDLTETPAAAHGVALARADAAARIADQPLCRHLGADTPPSSLPVNATVGDADSDATVEAARTAVGHGYSCLKLKVGARSVAADVDRLRAVREAVGPRVELRADANGAWSRTEARRALAAFADADVAYVEQPLPATDLAGHAAFDGPVDVALDESLTEYAPERVLDAADPDVLVCKPMVLGGPERTVRVAAMAAERGVRSVVTTTIDAVVARTAAVHVAAAFETPPACGLATADRLASDLAADPAPVDGGTIRVPNAAGLGIDPAEVA